jgi:anti-sigma B factor antagonist
VADVQQTVRVALAGDIDIATLAVFGDALERCVAAGGNRLVLDMSEVTFMDSQGLHMLLATDVALRDAGGELVVAAPSRQVRRLLDVSGVGIAVEP